MNWDEFNYSDFNINNEYSKLYAVMIGFTNFNKEIKDFVPINSVFENSLKNKLPKQENIENEVNKLVQTIEENNILVYRPTKIVNPLIDRNSQLYTRDIGFVIKNILFIPQMILPIRKSELAGLDDLIKNIIPNQNKLNFINSKEYSFFKNKESSRKIKQNIIFLNKKDCFIEGGDVILYKNIIFVGIGPRTNMNGFFLLKEYIDKYFKKITMIPIKHKCVHLDCCFNPIYDNIALICEDYMIDYPEEIKKMDLIKISKEESDDMLTNILCIGDKKLIVNNGKQCKRVNKLLKKKDFELIKISFNHTNLFGGSFRCITMPLSRYDIKPHDGTCSRCRMELISCVCKTPIPQTN